jgi:Lrp/AsnC family transcriptional regulator for asnA, asnC and gidA
VSDVSDRRTRSVALDAHDRAIIERLQQDGRMPYTRLATDVGLSESAVRQRVARLTELGVIQVVAVTDPLSVGMRRVAMIGLRVEGDARKVARELASLDEVTYLVSTAGSFDLLAEVVVGGDEELFEFLNDKVRPIPGVRGTETFLYLRLEKQTYTFGAH